MRRIFPAIALALLVRIPSRGDPVAVRHPEGTLHGFLTLSSAEGAALADGDLFQTVHAARVTSRLVFRFHDGSVQDETVVFTQEGTFRMVSDHLVQHGPAFPRPMDVTIDPASGRVTVRTTEDGREKTYDERMDLPPDLANGMVLVLVKNLRPGAARSTLSMVAATPSPRLVKLVLAPSGKVPFTTLAQPTASLPQTGSQVRAGVFEDRNAAEQQTRQQSHD